MYNTKELTNNDRTFILMFIAKLYEISYALYEIISSPDIDVDDFVKIIVSSIDTVKKHIPRCDDAFNKIIESIDILKNNFDGYYKEFVASNNPSIIMENFVLDVSKNTKATPVNELDCTLCRLCIQNCSERAIHLHYYRQQ